MSPLRWLLALPFLALLALFGSTGCGRAETDGEEQAVTAGALALTTDAVAFQIESLPPNMAAGVPGTMTVRALDANGDTATLYAGTVRFASSDLAALLPAPRTLQAGVATNVPITFVQSGAQTVTVSDSESPAITGTAGTTVSAATNSAITAPANVTAGATALAATTTNWNGATYTWTIWNGTLTAGQGTRAVTFTAGQTGTLTLGVIAVRNGAVRTGSRAVAVAAVPQTPSITAATAVAPSSTGNTAWVTAVTGMKYTWTVTRASITSSGGTAGVTSGGINKITYTSQATGPVVLSVVEKNAANATSAPATVSIPVVANAPRTPTITAASPVTEGEAGRTASVTARTGMSYVWTLLGGAITSPGGTSGEMVAGKNRVTYTAGPAGTIAFTCKETNGTYFSAPALKSVTSIGAPQTPVVTAASLVLPSTPDLTASVPARADMTYSWSITGGTITSAAGGVTSNGVNTVTYTSGGPGILTLQAVELNAAGAASAPGTATVDVTAPPAASGEMYFIAHQDDDLLFMNPDIERSILAGRRTRAVFVTAGDPGTCTECWQARENGVWNAYSAMANVEKDWTCTPTAFGGKTVSACVLDTAPHVSVVFMRLPDGGLSSLWSTEVGPPFWVSPVASLTSVDNAYTVTRDEAITLIHDILADFHPAVVGAMDGSLAYGDDHYDHITVGLFGLDAALRHTDPIDFRFYRGYNIYGNWFNIPSPEPENLSPAEYAEKVRIMEAYAGGFPVDSDFDHWCHRRYAASSVVSGTGPLVTPGGKCLDTQAGGTQNGAPIQVRTCDESGGQIWSISPDGKVARATGRCLARSGATAVLADCATDATQQFKLFHNGQLRGASGACLTVSWDDTSVGFEMCDADRTTDKYVPLPHQRFTQVFGASARWSQSTDFSDADVGGSRSYYATFDLGRLGADSRMDAFVRSAPGATMATNVGLGFGPIGGTPGAFGDAAGWLPEPYGTTVQLGDVSGDGIADVCGRSATGIACAITEPTGALGAVTPWSTDFGDATFGGAAYYPSVRLGDVDGDGYADVCGRSSTGVVCARNTHAGSFAPATSWLAGDFTDAAGFDAAPCAGTLRLGDVNGDGKADVCMRGAAGVRCAISNGSTAFTDAHLWSFRAEWSDAAGWGASAGRYGSLDLGDVNGDGKADLCGRATTGLVCAPSDGTAFEGAMPVAPFEYTDSLGWAAEPHGASLRLGELSGDARADVCGRDPGGLVCALAP